MRLLQLILQIRSFLVHLGHFRGCSRRRRGRRGAGLTLGSWGSLQGALPLEQVGWGRSTRGLTRRVSRDVGKAGPVQGWAGLAPSGRAAGNLAQGGAAPAAPASPGARAVSSLLTVTPFFILEHNLGCIKALCWCCSELGPRAAPARGHRGLVRVGLQQRNPPGDTRGHCRRRCRLQEGTGLLHSPKDEGTPRNSRPRTSSVPSSSPWLSSTESMAAAASPLCSCPKCQDLEALGYLFLPFAPRLSLER